jgi:hypothetical protein
VLAGVAAFDTDERVYRVTLSPTQYSLVSLIRAVTGPGREFQEALDFMNAAAGLMSGSTLADLLALPFKGPPFSAGRYSDGSYGVLYTAREQKTAAHEYSHWTPRNFGAGIGHPFRVRMHLISCRLSGRAKDVVPLLADNTWLVAEDHARCQRLGAEAKIEGLAALVAPSARHPGGSTSPIFSEAAASQPLQEAEVHVTVDPAAPGGPAATFTIV